MEQNDSVLKKLWKSIDWSDIKSWIITLLLVILCILAYFVGDIIFSLISGELISKDFLTSYKDAGVSFYSILLLKNAALVFLLVFFIREYSINQKQYFQYKFKKNVAYNITAVEDRFIDKFEDDKIKEFSSSVYKEVIYKEPQWDKKSLKEIKDK